jgi:hypothetical protein
MELKIENRKQIQWTTNVLFHQNLHFFLMNFFSSLKKLLNFLMITNSKKFPIVQLPN